MELKPRISPGFEGNGLNGPSFGRYFSQLNRQCPQVKQHLRRVANCSAKLAKHFGLRSVEIVEVKMTGALHDLGKVFVPPEILSKPTPLSLSELKLIHEVPIFSATLAHNFGLSESIQTGIFQRHERVDGRGYPLQLLDHDISLAAKMVAVVDTFDCLIHEQPYRAAYSPLMAIGIIRSNTNLRFDPEIVDCFTKIVLNCKTQPF